MTQPEPLDTLPPALRRGLRPDPIPPLPDWLPPSDRRGWMLGAAAGVALGRRLAALDIRNGMSAEAAGGLPLLEPADDLMRPFWRGLAGLPLEGRGDG
jgi:hypothetical protein